MRLRPFTTQSEVYSRKRVTSGLQAIEDAMQEICSHHERICQANGTRTVEQEFGLDTLLPGGRTMGKIIAPQLQHAKETGQLPQGLHFFGDETPASCEVCRRLCKSG